MLIRMLADAGLVTVSYAIAMGVRLLYLIAFEAQGEYSEFVRRDALDFLKTCPFVVAICLFVFWNSGFYTYSKHYLSKYKTLVVFQAVSLSYVIFGFGSYFVSGGQLIARSAFLLSWLLTGVVLVSARVWSDVWKHHVTPERESLTQKSRDHQRVLVIGGAGYIGSTVVPRLLELGCEVRLLDMLLFGREPISHFVDHPNLDLIQGDFRNLGTVLRAVKDVDAVIHLGAIVGDPACSLDEELTIDVNLVSTRMIAELAKSAGVKQFVFASTCSVYGACDDLLDERSEVRPVSLYGDTKHASENVLKGLADDNFSPTILRFGTIYGLSGRTRFDLVVNLLTAKAKIEGKITVHGGNQWRPFVHVEDAGRAVVMVLQSPPHIVANEVFNVGSNEQNYTISQIAELVLERVVDAELHTATEQVDHRNYRVSFDKIHKLLGFQPQWTVAQGIQQVLEAIAAGEIEDYAESKYSNAKFLTEEGTDRLAKDLWARQLIDDLTRK
jgi:nucleoside-diphosphate-sugar epimerase